MADMLRPRLNRLQELSKTLNSKADEISTVVQGVESYLSDVCRIGIYANVEVESDGNEEEGYSSTKYLVYGRYGPKYRIFIADVDEHCGNLVNHNETLWANCPRDVKLASYMKLPKLLDHLIQQVEDTIEKVEVNTEAIEAILPPKSNRKETPK